MDRIEMHLEEIWYDIATEFDWIRIRQVMSFCGHSHEHSSSIKVWRFLCCLSGSNELLKKNSVPWSGVSIHVFRVKVCALPTHLTRAVFSYLNIS
jgi:hypothetical protein